MSETKGELGGMEEDVELIGSCSGFVWMERDEGIDSWGRREAALGVTVADESPEEPDEPIGFTGDIQRDGGRES